MARVANADEVVEQMRLVRQARRYEPTPVDAATIAQLVEIARWTGSSRNTQPWHFIVVTDKEQLRQISEVRTPINWVADAPLAIAIVLDGKSEVSEAFDEGRVSERLLVAARLLGLGGGTAWFGDAGQQARGKEILGIPPERTARSVVVIGTPTTFKDHRPNPSTPGRRPVEEVVSHERFGESAG